MRFFNTAGRVDPRKHYCLSPLGRLDLAEILGLIEQEQYFTVHSPRQTGKTSTLLALMDYLNNQGQYRCAYVNVEAAQTAREDVQAAMAAILDELATWAKIRLKDPFIEEIKVSLLAHNSPHTALTQALTQWATHCDRPLVLIIDEIDSLVGDTLLSVLRQLRAGYARRPLHFPQCIALCGVRDLHDYRIQSSREQVVITGGSAFNIKARSVRLSYFSQIDLETLFKQHSDETGQIIHTEALERIWQLTGGQPWLVNTLGYELCSAPNPERDYRRPITFEEVEAAKETLIMRRVCHVDQLADKLEEPSIRRVIEAMLTGDALADDFHKGDVDYAVDLGLVQRAANGALSLANPLYREIIPRQLVCDLQTGMTLPYGRFHNKSTGRLDFGRIIKEFQQFCRDYSTQWLQRFPYRRAALPLLFQAYLQSVIDGNGRIEREYGLGRMRTDILVTWPISEGLQRSVIELRSLDKSLVATMIEGMEQTRAFMVRNSTKEGHLIMFDPDVQKPWEEKIFARREDYKGHIIDVWGL